MSEEIKMNLYQKLQEARCRLQNLSLKKTGMNKFAGYSYYELGDILPAINNINKDLGLCTHITFNNDFAVLNIINSDNGDKIEFTSPMAGASLKGAHDIQNLGATETYQRRYLYMSAYEIVEHDAVDSSKGKEKKSIDSSNIDTIKKMINDITESESLKSLFAELSNDYIINQDVRQLFTDKKEELNA
jgi:hypothetical protein